MRMHGIAPLLLATGMFIFAGCMNGGRNQNDLKSELRQLQEQNRKLAEDNRQLQSVVATQQTQIKTLQKLGEKRMEKLFHVEQIELGKYTGGTDIDGNPGHEGIKVYLRPLDQHGSVIKAAGEVTVQLFDLAADPKENLIGRYHWSVEQVAKQWSSGFFTYHYSFLCPWKQSPGHDEITVRVEFTDYLTGRVFTAQKACEVKLPASNDSADN